MRNQYGTEHLVSIQFDIRTIMKASCIDMNAQAKVTNQQLPSLLYGKENEYMLVDYLMKPFER